MGLSIGKVVAAARRQRWSVSLSTPLFSCVVCECDEGVVHVFVCARVSSLHPLSLDLPDTRPQTPDLSFVILFERMHLINI